MEILIKNMVCRHCAAVVESIFSKAGIDNARVEIGRVDVAVEPTAPQLALIDSELRENGFERIKDRNTALVESIKHAVHHHVRDEQECRLNLSACLEEHIGTSYDSLSRLFSQSEGRTIEKYSMAVKIEYVKELIARGNMTLSEIAYTTGYSGTAHLSRQFRAVTGMSPTEYIRNGNFTITPLNEL